MRNLRDFSKGEWLRFEPLMLAIKQVRNDLLQAAYLKRKPEALPQFLRENSRLQNQNVVLIVAFEQAWALDFLLQNAPRHLPDAHLLVFDNSRKMAARKEIERVCHEHGTPYLALPPNSTRHANRSHGMAMTWIYQNVVRAIKPRIFAFIDHDLIPFDTVELSQAVAGQPFYGTEYCNRNRVTKWGWALWAGYCMFDYSAMGKLPLNFLYDFSMGLDTGGRNWHHLYEKQDRRQLRMADSRMVKFTDPTIGHSRPVQIVDGRWLHLRGAGHGVSFKDDLAAYKAMVEILEAGTASKMPEFVCIGCST